MRILFALILFSSLSRAQNWDWKTVFFNQIDSSTVEFIPQHTSYKNGKTKTEGLFRHIRLNYGELTEYYLPVGRHVSYDKKGRLIRVQHFNHGGFAKSDSLFRKNGNVKMVKIIEAEKSTLETDGKTLQFNDKSFYMTIFRKNGQKESEGPGESNRDNWLIKKGTWKNYNASGSLKNETKY